MISKIERPSKITPSTPMSPTLPMSPKNPSKHEKLLAISSKSHKKYAVLNTEPKRKEKDFTVDTPMRKTEQMMFQSFDNSKKLSKQQLFDKRSQRLSSKETLFRTSTYTSSAESPSKIAPKFQGTF